MKEKTNGKVVNMSKRKKCSKLSEYVIATINFTDYKFKKDSGMPVDHNTFFEKQAEILSRRTGNKFNGGSKTYMDFDPSVQPILCAGEAKIIGGRARDAATLTTFVSALQKKRSGGWCLDSYEVKIIKEKKVANGVYK